MLLKKCSLENLIFWYAALGFLNWIHVTKPHYNQN